MPRNKSFLYNRKMITSHHKRIVCSVKRTWETQMSTKYKTQTTKPGVGGVPLPRPASAKMPCTVLQSFLCTVWLRISTPSSSTPVWQLGFLSRPHAPWCLARFQGSQPHLCQLPAVRSLAHFSHRNHSLWGTGASPIALNTPSPLYLFLPARGLGAWE